MSSNEREDLDDLALLRAWRDGDKVAGNLLVRRHFSVVFRFFKSKGVSSVDDLTHQSFMVALESAKPTAIRTTFRAYLLGIARHQLFHLYRKKRRGERAMALHRMSADELVGSPSSILAARDELELLAAALRTIPVELQIVVELYYWENLSVAEVAEATDVAVGTVKSRLSRARAVLRSAIESANLPSALRRSTIEHLDQRDLGTNRETPPQERS